jgi:hypothetical protein
VEIAMIKNVGKFIKNDLTIDKFAGDKINLALKDNKDKKTLKAVKEIDTIVEKINMDKGMSIPGWDKSCRL